jgi:hypothetical protein
MGCDRAHPHSGRAQSPAATVLGIIGETMPSIYRISQPGREPVVDVGSVEAIEGAIRDGVPGCYHVDEIAAEPLLSGHTSRRWGTAIKRPDGRCTIDPDPWPTR